MKILLVTQYFPPELGAAPIRTGDLARRWARDGNPVTVLTGMPNHPTGVVPPAYRGRLRLTETWEGVRVRRCWLLASPNAGLLRRTFGQVTFAAMAVLFGFRDARRADVVVVSSPSFFSIFSAWVLARVARRPLVLDIRDLWPAVFVDAGVLREGLALTLLYRAEAWAYRHADAVVTVTDGFAAYISERAGQTPVFVVTNGVDVDRFDRNMRAGETGMTRERLGIGPDAVLAGFVGNLGSVNDLGTVLAACAEIGDGCLHLLFLGEGAARDSVAESIEKLGLDWCHLMPGIPPDDVPRVLADLDIGLSAQQGSELFGAFVPAKIFYYFAAGLPVVALAQGEAAARIEAGDGVVVEPGDVGGLAEILRRLATDPEERARRGRVARAAAETTYDRAALAARYLQILDETVRRSGRRPA